MIKHSVWLQDLRSGRFICLVAMLIFGCFSITTTCLLVRSDKNTELENILRIQGDYDEIIYETGIGFEDVLSTSELVADLGVYYELGTVTSENDTFSFKAAALKDALSEDIYHMTCIRGRYPKSDDEIAIDISVANTYGIAPYPGESLNLKKYDSNGEYIETREFKISGVFKCSSNETLGGWERCPYFALYSQDLYAVPAVFFFSSDLDSWNCTKETVFFRACSGSADVLGNEVHRLLRESGHVCTAVENNDRRTFGYSNYVGVDPNAIYSSNGGLSWDDLSKAVDDGLFKRDFYAAIIFPIISILVIITEVVSLYMISKNIIADRKERYAILRSLGMSSKRIVKNLLIEIFGIGIICAIIGIGLGYAGHLVLIGELNNKFHLRLFDGIHVPQMVKQITYDPIVMSILACVCSLALALIIPLYRLHKMYPAELLSSSESVFVGRNKRLKQKNTHLKNGWMGLLNKRIDLHDGSTMLAMIIVLSSALFGYVFFRAYAEQETIESKGNMAMLGIDGQGYVVTRSSELEDWGYIVPNRHDAGIIPSFPEAIENNSNVEKSWAVMFNESTRMVFDKEPDESIKQLLGYRSLNVPQSDDPYVKEKEVAEKIIFEHTGYNPDVYMYQLPTVGLTIKELNGLNGEVIAGNIDIDKIKSGEEVVLAVPAELQELCQKCFPIGSPINFDDILLTEEEENLNFGALWDSKWVVYENDIETDYGKEHVSFGAFGTKYGIETKVGAIVVLHDERDIHEYLTSGNWWIHQWSKYENSVFISDEPTYGMSVLCLADSFASWGLPDRNFTSVRVELQDGCDIYEFDEFWYKALAGSVEVQTKSTFDYLDDISMGKTRVMTFFFVLLSVLVVLGTMSIISGLYTKTRSNYGRFQTLRRLGLSVHQASLMIYTQNIFYPIIATLIAIAPIYYTQGLFDSMEKKLQTGEFDILATQWYKRIPYWTDLFSYDFIPALICCLLLGFLLIFIGTLPQILYLRKMKMIETREE